MNKVGKLIIGGVVVTGIAGGIYLATRKPSSPANAQGQGSLSIQIFDNTGNLVTGGRANRHVGSISSGMVSGGKGYSVVATMNNTSVYKGTTTPAPYTFALHIAIAMADGTVLLSTTRNVPMSAGQTEHTESFSFDIPYTSSGGGAVSAVLEDSSGNPVSPAVGPTFTVNPADITPSGTITI